MTGSRSHPAHQINGVTELNCASFTSFYSVNSNEFKITNLAVRILKQILRFSIYNYAKKKSYSRAYNFVYISILEHETQ